MNWIQREAAKADESNDIAIIENPETKEYLDGILRDKFADRVWERLNATGYKVHPARPEIRSGLSYSLVRNLDFMLFDFLGFPFLKGTISASSDGWMFEREFWLGLPKDTNPEFMFSILSDERFQGIPPALEIQESVSEVNRNIYYIITLKAGNGTSWGGDVVFSHALSTFENVLSASLEMYNLAMADKMESKEDVARFKRVAAIGFLAS
jgi:hypothetical protein